MQLTCANLVDWQPIMEERKVLLNLKNERMRPGGV